MRAKDIEEIIKKKIAFFSDIRTLKSTSGVEREIEIEARMRICEELQDVLRVLNPEEHKKEEKKDENTSPYV